ncbi:hypothetical protein V1477_017711 [Vespula maculifrons]|uniref:Uncharacterized protein n=1 Tax=Vespula maculifrons TaxID=7453 RepID=A0ABD2B0K1_VESMC
MSFYNPSGNTVRFTKRYDKTCHSQRCINRLCRCLSQEKEWSFWSIKDQWARFSFTKHSPMY